MHHLETNAVRTDIIVTDHMYVLVCTIWRNISVRIWPVGLILSLAVILLFLRINLSWIMYQQSYGSLNGPFSSLALVMVRGLK